MSATNNEYKTLIDEALHNHFHDTPETEMILKDWLYGVCNKAEAFGEIKKVNAECQFPDDVGFEVHSIIRKYESEV